MQNTKENDAWAKVALCVAVPFASVFLFKVSQLVLDKDSKNIQMELDLKAQRFSLATS